METAAREFGEDPAELRRKNFIKTFPHQTPVAFNYDAGDYEASLDAALKASDYAGFPARKAEAAKRGKLRGIGFSSWIEACGLAPSAVVGSLGAGVGLWESAEVRVNFVGTVEVLTGAHSHGQSHETTFAQLVNDRLGIGVENISIVHGDTDKVQFGMGTYGSRTSTGMSAIYKALDKVEAKAKRIAAHLLEASESDIELENGVFKVAGTDKQKTFSEVAMAAYTGHSLPEGMEPGLKEGAFYDPTNFTFPAGTYICEVEVDPETGSTEIVQFVAADDFGTIINPTVVEGQIHGGIAHGIGQAMLEGVAYDPESGQLMTGSYMDYTMPRADNLPSFNVSNTVTLCPSNPIGMKGCGEAGAIGSPPAVINAITDAIGNNDLTMPATPERVWNALAHASMKQAAE
jgi:carbon-monoxide dehydrogenase large subunit